MTGILFIISAPSGAGKTSLVNELVRSTPNIKISTSYTTREKRPGEVEGIDYHFVSNAEFEKMIAEQKFLEYAWVYGHYYGTSKDWVEEQLANNIDVILEIDWQGAAQIKNLHRDSVSIFILPPSLEVLRQRLQNRQQDSAKIISERNAGAREEILHFGEFDYIIVNDNFPEALTDLQSIVRGYRLRGPRQAKKHAVLLSDLIKNV